MRLPLSCTLLCATLLAPAALAQTPPAPSPPASATATAIAPSAPSPPAPGATPAPAASPTAAPPPPVPPGYAPAAPPPPYPGQPAYAQPPGYYPPPYYEPRPPSSPPLNAHAHAGFFLRMGLGIGRMNDSTTIEGGTYAGGVDSGGGAIALEVDVGGAISKGFILAGSYTGTFLPNPDLKNDTRLARTSRQSQLQMLSVMGDVYPNPSGGFHVGGALGLASVRDTDLPNSSRSQDQSGLGLSAHVGYEWWVGNYWGLGGLFRFTYARAKGDYAGGTATDKVTAFTLLFSATYN